MMTSYQELFSIECLHGYFADSLCRVLELSPTPECASMLRRYQMLFRRTAAGGKVLYSVQGPTGSPWKEWWRDWGLDGN